MSFSNFVIKTGKNLDSDLQAIGFNVACEKPSVYPDIESVIVSASMEMVNKKDNRIGGLLVDWLTIHYPRINVDKLTKFVFSLNGPDYKFVRIFWCATAQRFLSKDQRFKRLSEMYKGRRVNFADRFLKSRARKTTKMLIEIKGEDKRFIGTCIRVPKGYFSERPLQIFSADMVAKNHLFYYYRVMMGPSYRADSWALLQQYPNISAYALQKRACCSYRTAYMVKKDYELLKKRDFNKIGNYRNTG